MDTDDAVPPGAGAAFGAGAGAGWGLGLAGIFGGLFCSYLALAAVLPVLPGHVRDAFGADDVMVGLAVTATALTAVVMRPIAGGLSDRHGHRLVMLLGAAAIGGGGVLYLLPLGFAGLLCVRLLLGVGEAAVFTAGAAWTISLAPEGRRGQLIGLYGVSMWGGITVGTLIGTALSSLGATAVWLFAASSPVLGLLFIGAVPAPGPVTVSATTPARHPLLLRPAVLPGISLALASSGYAGLVTFAVLHLEARGIPSGGLVLTIYGAAYAGTRLCIGHWPDRFGARRVAAWSGALEALGLGVIAVAPALWVAALGALVMGSGFSLLYPSLALLVMNRADPRQQGAAVGAYTSFWDLGLGVWGPAAGALAHVLGYSAVFAAGAGLALAAAAVALSVRLRPTPSAARAGN